MRERSIGRSPSQLAQASAPFGRAAAQQLIRTLTPHQRWSVVVAAHRGHVLHAILKNQYGLACLWNGPMVNLSGIIPVFIRDSRARAGPPTTLHPAWQPRCLRERAHVPRLRSRAVRSLLVRVASAPRSALLALAWRLLLLRDRPPTTTDDRDDRPPAAHAPRNRSPCVAQHSLLRKYSPSFSTAVLHAEALWPLVSS
jgi:hypothetical protein